LRRPFSFLDTSSDTTALSLCFRVAPQTPYVLHTAWGDPYTGQTMLTLQEQLDRLLTRKGEGDPMVQVLRNQILAERTGKTFQELYTGATPAASKKPVEAGLTPLLMNGQSPRSFRVEDDLLPAFHRVLLGLTSKRKTKLFYVAVADLSTRVDESVIYDVGDRVGDGLPIDYVRTHINDQGMTRHAGDWGG